MTLVALALCADRATAAVPAARPHISQVTRQVVREVTKRFQRVVAAVKIVQHRQDGFTRVAPQDLPTHVPAGLHDSQGTPFQFRLPPPVV